MEASASDRNRVAEKNRRSKKGPHPKMSVGWGALTWGTKRTRSSPRCPASRAPSRLNDGHQPPSASPSTSSNGPLGHSRKLKLDLDLEDESGRRAESSALVVVGFQLGSAGFRRTPGVVQPASFKKIRDFIGVVKSLLRLFTTP
eukprot:GHVS01099382.1.p2 GENE.GHVS01099382.1~~GHVS01099382.1.p2  ORF type:complete len:144 (-),score=7.00 GHVS01099382.1:317-748(-)